VNKGDLRLVIQLLKTHAAYVHDAEKHLRIERVLLLKKGTEHLHRAISILEDEEQTDPQDVV